MESYSKVWDDVLHNIRERVGPLRFNLWFKNTRLESFNDNYANIIVPNIFTQVCLQEKKADSKSYPPVNRILKLEDFVVGPNNRLAYTAALDMIKDKDSAFNPLFIHGTVGVGKTHILQGVLNKVKEEQNINAIYMSAEKWTNEFIYSLQKGKIEAFRQKFRNADMFLIDDVHF